MVAVPVRTFLAHAYNHLVLAQHTLADDWSRKFIFLYAFRYHNEAIHIVAENVLVPRGLVGIGRDKLDHSGAEIAEALTLYTSPQTTPVLVHCTQGKDRTGMYLT